MPTSGLNHGRAVVLPAQSRARFQELERAGDHYYRLAFAVPVGKKGKLEIRSTRKGTKWKLSYGTALKRPEGEVAERLLRDEVRFREELKQRLDLGLNDLSGDYWQDRSRVELLHRFGLKREKEVGPGKGRQL